MSSTRSDSPAEEVPKVGDLIADKYRVDGLLGEGGMGAILAATNELTGKAVAIKWLLPILSASKEHSERFAREAKAAARIDHPNVVTVFDVGRHNGSMFLVMERLYGRDLSVVMRGGPASPAEFFGMMLPVMRGVAAAHREGIVHRDIKPANIFLCTDRDGNPRQPKVVDFGISRFIDQTPGTTLTQDGSIVGTPNYMAPEQIRSARSADARCDIYALGVICYRGLSGKLPYEARSLTELIFKIVDEEGIPLGQVCPDLDPGILLVIGRATAHNPKNRYSTVEEFGEALEPFAGGGGMRTSSVWMGSEVPAEKARFRPSPAVPAARERPCISPSPETVREGIRRGETTSRPVSVPADSASSGGKSQTVPTGENPTQLSRGPVYAVLAVALAVLIGGAGALLTGESAGAAGRSVHAPPTGAGVDIPPAPLGSGSPATESTLHISPDDAAAPSVPQPGATPKAAAVAPAPSVTFAPTPKPGPKPHVNPTTQPHKAKRRVERNPYLRP